MHGKVRRGAVHSGPPGLGRGPWEGLGQRARLFPPAPPRELCSLKGGHGEAGP